MWLIGFFIGLFLSACLFGGNGWHIPIGGVIGAILWTVISSNIEDSRERNRRAKEEQQRKIEADRKAQEFAENARKLRELRLQREQEIENKYNSLKIKYPLGLPLFESISSYDDGKNSAELTKEEIIQCEFEIAKLQISAQLSLDFDNWENEQNNFSQFIYNISKSLCPNWGRYTYKIPYSRTNSKGETIIGYHKIWHLFCDSGCLDFSLDYSNYSSYKANGEKYSSLKEGKWTFNKPIFDKVNEFISSINKPIVIFRFDPNYFDAFYIDSQIHFEQSNLEIIIDNILGASTCSPYDNLDIPLSRHIVIFDMLTKNDELIDLCSSIFNNYKTHKPLVCYISLCKFFNSDEMQELIINKKNEIARLEEEKVKANVARQHLISSITNWEKINLNFPIKYLFPYYPTTCDFEANEVEWSNRWLVWNFKNTPGKTSAEDHNSALSTILDKISLLLSDSFSNEDLKYLTLFCIPASSKEKNDARYKEFARKLCMRTGMINSFDYVNILKEKIAKREGGETISSEILNFDENFFKGKTVILFDDIITSGKSMSVIKNRLEQLGAKVIAGISIGKTSHTRPNERKVPTLDDLPF